MNEFAFEELFRCEHSLFRIHNMGEIIKRTHNSLKMKDSLRQAAIFIFISINTAIYMHCLLALWLSFSSFQISHRASLYKQNV